MAVVAKINRSFAVCAFVGLLGLAQAAFGQSALQTSELHVSSQSVPYAGEAGTYEAVYSVTTPNGKLIIHSNVDNGSLSYELASGMGPITFYCSPRTLTGHPRLRSTIR